MLRHGYGVSWRLLGALLLAGACGSGEGDADGGVSSDGAAADGAAVDAFGSDAGLVPDCSALPAFDPLAGPAAGSGAYAAPSAAELDALAGVAQTMVEGRFEDGARAAGAIGYQLCRSADARGERLHLRPTDVSTGRAFAILRPDAVQGLIVEAPHPYFDTGTYVEALRIFEGVAARALIVSTTHRCASDEASGCDGVTSACGASEPYRASDVAHATDSAFHRLHVAIADAYPDDLVLSVHGMADDGVSLSDGTTGAVDADSAVARIAAAFAADGYPNVTSCNAGAGVPVEERLCGTTNTQGRHLNGSADACTSAASATSGRFVHMEQSRDVRDAPLRVVGVLFDALE